MIYQPFSHSTKSMPATYLWVKVYYSNNHYYYYYYHYYHHHY